MRHILSIPLLMMWLAGASAWNCPKSPESALEDLKYRTGEVSLRVVGGVSEMQQIVTSVGGDDVTLFKVREGKDAGTLYADTPAAFVSEIFNTTDYKDLLANHPSTIRWYFHTNDSNTNVDGIVEFVRATDLIEPMKKYISKPTLLDWMFSLSPRVTTTYKVNVTAVTVLENNHEQLASIHNNNPHVVLLDTHKIGSPKLLKNITDSISAVTTTELSDEETLGATLRNIYTSTLLVISDRTRYYSECIQTLEKRRQMERELAEQETRHNEIRRNITDADKLFAIEKENFSKSSSLFYQVQIALFVLCVSGVTGSGYVSLVIAWPFVKSIITTFVTVYKYVSGFIWSIVVVLKSVWAFVSAPPTPGTSDRFLRPPSSFQPDVISLDLPDSLKRSETVRGAWRKAGKALYATRRLIKSVKVVSPIKKEELGFPTKVSRVGSNVSRERMSDYPGVVVLDRACADGSFSGVSYLRRAINLTSPSAESTGTGDDVSRTASSLSSRGWAALRSKCSLSLFSSNSNSSFDLMAAQSKIADLESQLQSQQQLLRERRHRMMNSSFNSTASHSTVRTFPISDVDVDTDDESEELLQHLRLHPPLEN